MLQHASQHWLKLLHSNVGDKVGADALCAAVDAHLDFLRTAPDEVRAMYLLWFTSIDPGSEYRANVARVHQAQRLAEQFCGRMVGIVSQWLVNARMPLREMHQQLKLDIRARLVSNGRTAIRSSRIKSKGNHDDRRVHI